MSASSSNQTDLSGILLPEDAFVVIVRTEWNAAAVDKLHSGCQKLLDQHKVKHSTITVPGAFEIPFTIRTFWKMHKSSNMEPKAFIALGCVLRGGTPHFEYVSQAVTDGILQLNMELPVPTIFGILTVNDQQQIEERTGGKHGNKGEEAAITALKMIALSARI